MYSYNYNTTIYVHSYIRTYTYTAAYVAIHMYVAILMNSLIHAKCKLLLTYKTCVQLSSCHTYVSELVHIHTFSYIL